MFSKRILREGNGKRTGIECANKRTTINDHETSHKNYKSKPIVSVDRYPSKAEISFSHLQKSNLPQCFVTSRFAIYIEPSNLSLGLRIGEGIS